VATVARVEIRRRRVWAVRNTKRIHGRKRADRRESKYTAGENIGPRFAIQYTCTCARDVTRVWHVFLRLQSCRFHAHTHTHAHARARAYTHTHTHTHIARTQIHVHRCHPHMPTPTHRLHTYVGTVHIKLGEGGARSPSLPHKNKKHGSIHKQEGWGCSNLKRTPEFLPAES